MVSWACHLSIMPDRHLVWQWQQMKPAPKFLKNGMRPRRSLNGSILKKEQRNEVRESMVEQFSGSMNTGKMMVLEGNEVFSL